MHHPFGVPFFTRRFDHLIRPAPLDGFVSEFVFLKGIINGTGDEGRGTRKGSQRTSSVVKRRRTLPAEKEARGMLVRRWQRLGVGLLVLLAGCAKFPPQPGVGVSRDRLIITLTYAAPLDPRYFYFITLDDDSNQLTGPMPSLTIPWGNGWAALPRQADLDPNTGKPRQGPNLSHFVEIRVSAPGIGQALVYRVTNPTLENYRQESLGAPLELTFLQNNQVRVTLDMRQLWANPTPIPDRIEMNFISVDELRLNPNDNTPRQGFDGLGISGNEFVSIPLTSNQTFPTSPAFNPEPTTAGDARIDALDLVDWRVQVIRAP
jgi:hypothetical protein